MAGNRRDFLKRAGFGSLLLLTSRFASGAAPSPAAPPSADTGAPRANDPASRPNILLLVADDMNWDAPACFGGTTPGITPNIDRLAAGGLRFEHAHVTIAVCQPSRSVLMTGRYPHRNGAEGFGPIDTDVTTLQERLAAAGYLNGILGKVVHLAPREKFPWAMAYDMKDLGQGRDPSLYSKYAVEFFRRAAAEKRPFFLMANSHDPHRPFHGSQDDFPNVPVPSRVYRPDEVDVPGFLPALDDVRNEVAQYYSSVRRCDDTVGAVLRTLAEAGREDDTLVMFLSDNGMAFPFSKTNCYLNSTRTPWIVRWPGRVAPGTVDRSHFISGIDFMPTILAAAGLPPQEGVDGRSFLPLLTGSPPPPDAAEERGRVFTQFHETSARNRYPMRCVQEARYAYIFNPWSDGRRVFKNESQAGLTFKAMVAAAVASPEVAARVRFFEYRAPEEFYDLADEPDALHNRIDDPSCRKDVERLREQLLDWMKRTGDPAFEALASRSPEAMARFMASHDARAAALSRVPAGRKPRGKAARAASRRAAPEK
ncbi:MAG: sulfatase [bacterium]|nr:sulfatase [bacterium]